MDASTFYGVMDRGLGLSQSPSDMTFAQMAGRTFVVFVFGAILVRFADRRFLGRNAGFDVLLGIVLGSVLSRAINGQAAFFPTLGASATLVILHHLLGSAACRWHFMSRAAKGSPRLLVRNGQIDAAELRRNKISLDDLKENLRLNGNVTEITAVAEARLERNGQISVVRERSVDGD